MVFLVKTPVLAVAPETARAVAPEAARATVNMVAPAIVPATAKALVVKNVLLSDGSVYGEYT